MPPLAACRGCLSTDVYLSPAPHEYVQQLEDLTKIRMHSSDEKPIGLCRICCHYLRKYHKFRECCMQADTFLNQMKLTRNKLTPEMICGPVEVVVLSPLNIEQVSDNEMPDVVKEEVENNDEEESSEDEATVRETWSDSSDTDATVDGYNNFNSEIGNIDDTSPIRTISPSADNQDSYDDDETNNQIGEPLTTVILGRNDLEPVEEEILQELIAGNLSELTRDPVAHHSDNMFTSQQLLKDSAGGSIHETRNNKECIEPDDCVYQELEVTHDHSRDDDEVPEGNLCGEEKMHSIKTALSKASSSNLIQIDKIEMPESKDGNLSGESDGKMLIDENDGLCNDSATVSQQNSMKPMITLKSVKIVLERLNLKYKSGETDNRMEQLLTSSKLVKETKSVTIEAVLTVNKDSNVPLSFQQDFNSKRTESQISFKDSGVDQTQNLNEFNNISTTEDFNDSNIKIKYFCNHCDSNFTSKHMLRRHIELKRSNKVMLRQSTCDKPYKCTVCEKMYRTKQTLGAHRRLHTNAHQCSLCQMSCRSKVELARHQTIHTGEKPHTCPECDKKFAHQSNLSYHLKQHSEERPYKCSFCEKSYKTKGSLNDHLKFHGEKRMKCTVCDRRFYKKNQLDTHMNRHTGERRYACTKCDKRFFTAGNLQKHMSVHTDVRGYQCSLCGKSFKRKFTLDQHIKHHSDKKSFECKLCDKSFKTKFGLYIHSKCHDVEGSYECKICKKRLKTCTALHTHMIIHSDKKPFQCIICEKRFKRSSNLKQHHRSHKVDTLDV